MADPEDEKISGLTATTTLGDADLVTTVQGGVNKKLTGTDLKSEIIAEPEISYVQQTGIVSGCELSVHPTNNQAVKIAPGILKIVDTYTDKLNPVITDISYAGNPELVITGIATTPVTNLAIDFLSADVQQEPLFTNNQKRTLAVVGQVNHIDQVQVRNIGTLGRQPVWQTGQTVSDLMEDNGVTNKDGNVYSAASNDLTIKRTEGVIFAQGAGTDKNSNELPTIEDDPILVFLYFYLNASLVPQFAFKITPNNLADPDNYVKNGVLTAVPAGLWSVQRISMAVGPGSTSIITYGREVYDSLRTALLSIEGEEFIPSPNAENVVRRYFMAIKQGATDLSDISQAFFTPVDNPEIPQYIDNTNRGIVKFPTITQEGGLDISWLDGKVYDITSQDAVLTDASIGSQTLNDNAVNYLYWSTGITLTLSITAPVEPQISISKFNVQDGVIYFESDEDLLNTQESNLLSGIANVFPSVVTEGLNVSPDPDATNLFDVAMEAGTYYEDLHRRVDSSQILSRTIPLIRHFHTVGVWDSDTNAEIDNDFYDDGTNVVALTANRYAKSLFITCGAAIHWVYPREQFTTIAGAELADLPKIPPGLVGLPTLTAYIQQENDITLATYPGARWIDVRSQGGAAGAAAGSSVFSDDAFKIQNGTDNTKELVTDLSNITTGTERTLTMADRDLDLNAPNFGGPTVFNIDGASVDFTINKSGGTSAYNLNGGTGISTFNGILRTTDGQVIHNYQFQDNDYEIRKLTSGTAYKYDAGIDTQTLNGEVIINGENADNDLTHYDQFGSIAYQYNAGLLSHVWNGPAEFNGSSAFVLNKNFDAKNISFNKSGSGSWLNYIAATDELFLAGKINFSGATGYETNATFFSKIGGSGSDGLSIRTPKDAIADGITVAQALTPAVDNRVVANCLDAGIYTEFVLTSKPYTDIEAPNISIVAAVEDQSFIGSDNTVRIKSQTMTSSTDTPILTKNGSGDSTYISEYLGDTVSTASLLAVTGGGTLNSFINVVEGVNRNILAFDIQDGHINHQGIDVIGKTNLVASQSGNWDITGDWDGDFIVASSATVNVKITGNWTGDLTSGASANINITCGSRTLDAEDDSIDDDSDVRIYVKNIGNDYTWSPDRDLSGTTDYDVSPADTGKIFTNQNTNTLNDILNFNLPPAAANLHYRFDNVRIVNRIINLVLDGTDIFISPTNVQISSTISSGESNSYIEIFSTGLGRWYIVQQHGQWSNTSAAGAINVFSSSRSLVYTDVGNTLYTTTDSTLTLTIDDTTNANTSIGAVIKIARMQTTVTGTSLQILTGGSAVIVSREANNYVANPSNNKSYVAFATAEKITATTWTLEGDVSPTAN